MKPKNELEKFLKNHQIINTEILSNSFNILCEKITLENKKSFVIKYYSKFDNKFNSIITEGKSLLFINKKFPHLFPSVKLSKKNLLIMEYIKHDKCKKKDYQTELLKPIIEIHSETSSDYGFDFNTQIGGLKQPNNRSRNWIEFFRDQRLNMIFEIINKTNPMPKFINHQIEILIKNLHNFIPKNPKISLLHGDLWEGNILFNNGKFVGLIDPGIFFGHNELELAYLTWFNYVNDNFLRDYSQCIHIDKYFYKYEPIYQLYYSLLNVHLWDRVYVNDVKKLLNKIK